MKLVLASGSPRRRQLLETAGIPIHSIHPANIVEQQNTNESPLAYCTRLAKEKAHTVATNDHWTLAADTIVCMNDLVFEKPRDDKHALEMLTQLSTDWHSVITCWHLVGKEPDNGCIEMNSHSISWVKFRPLSQIEIENYIKTGETKDKAGAYGIQGLGATLIEEIKGSYSNIVGLPLREVLAALAKANIYPERK